MELMGSNGLIRSSGAGEGRGFAARQDPELLVEQEFEALSTSIRAIRDAVRTLLDEIDPDSPSVGRSGD
jgi:hypothetical protein